jgi:hypothetical protein
MQNKQYTSRLLMIEPVAFRFNTETASNNYYQKVIDGLNAEETQSKALEEFTDFVTILREKGIDVTVIKDTLNPDTPDSIFPNNWISFHENGTVVLFPMYAENRRKERRLDILETLRENGLLISEVVDMTDVESESLFLEGTGSMILDRENCIAFAAISQRTDEDLVYDFCRQMDFRPCIFHSFQTVGQERLPIYHTNVMMCVADKFVVICLDSIDDLEERHAVIETIEDTNKEIIEITEEQVEHFAGNMLQVGDSANSYLVMSSAAYGILDKEQIKSLEEHCTIIHSTLDTIEACGGGSARCMMAEVFLPKA